MRVTVFFLAGVFLATVALAAHGQSPAPPRDGAAPPAGATTVTGHVVLVEGTKTTPVRRARVSLERDGQPNVTTDTDTDGHFTFAGIPGGQYRLTVDKAGFVREAGDVTRALARPDPVNVPASGTTDLTIRMVRGAALEGRVVNSAGDPVPNLLVSAVRMAYVANGQRPVVVKQARTDDLGRFRIHTLTSGEFYVDAAPDPQGNSQRPPGERSGQAHTFFPGTDRASEARVISLQPGQTISGLDFAIRSVPLATVTGQVVDSTGAKVTTFSVRLAGVSAATANASGFLLPNSNTFQYSDVPPGDYWFLATAVPATGGPMEFMRERVTIDGQDRKDWMVRTAPAVIVRGRVEVEGGVALPPGLELMSTATTVEPPMPRGQTVAPCPVAADGTFMLPGLVGPRLVRAARLPPTWAVKSVLLNDHDVTDTGTEFSGGAGAPSLRVIITPDTGSVSGQISKDSRPAGGRVVLFGDDESSWGMGSRTIFSSETGADGRFSFAGVLPGKYHAVAVGYLDDGQWTDPATLRRLLPLATAVTIDAHKTATLSLVRAVGF
jgi:hypothetical protein